MSLLIQAISMDSSPQPLEERLLEMPSEQVKSLMLAWLQDDSLSRQQFSTWVETTQPNLDWGIITPQLEFRPLSDADMLAQSLVALADYRDNGESISHQDVAAWAESLEADHELPCPQ